MADTLTQALLEASLLASLPEEDEGSIVIDVDRRTMVLPTGFFFGVYNDKDVLKVPFVIPRYYNELDLSEFQITVNYINSAGYGNIYRVTDAEVTDSAIRFKWITGRGVFVKEGTVRFIVCLRQIRTNGEVEKEFNTTIASANVLKGLEVDENPDPIAYSILAHMEELKDQAEAAVEVAEGAADRVDDAVTEAEQAIAAMYHSPYIAPTAADMLSHDKVYVYTGTETGYTFGNWYYWNGSTFVSGGVYNATAFETDATLSIEGAAADAGAVGYQLSRKPEVRESTEEDVDLDVCDDDGNVLVRFSDGHVKTKNFDSQDIKDEVEELQENLVSLENDLSDEIDSVKEDLLPRATTEQGVDLDITDENGNVIVRFAGGHIQTKEFDSSNITPSPSGSGNVDVYMSDSNADLVLADNFGNVIAQFSEGHIRTKEFDSSDIVQSVNGSASVLHTLNGTDYTKTFEYNPSTANKQTIVGEFKAGDTILCHFSNAADDVTDICNTRWATYGYVDTSGSEHTLGQERAYNFGRFVLPEDTTGIFANFPTELLESGTYTCKFLVYKLGAYKRQPHIVTVGADGKRMFTSVRAAMDSFNDNNAYNTYEIWVYPGTYDILADYTDEEIRAEGFKGLWVKNGVTIKGIGHREQIILHGELDPDAYSSTIRNQISTLNMSGNCGLENLTVTNQYNRYAVHDDHMSGFYQEQTRIVENCKFLSWNASSGGIGQAAYGAGGHNNKKLIIRNCDLGDRLIIHNTQLMTVSMTAIVENSTAQQVTLTDNNNTGFTAKTRVEFNNCNFDYVMHDKTSDSTEPTMILCGTGTNNVKLDCEAGTLYNLGDCMKFPAVIPAGQAVKMSGIRTVVATTSLDDIYGISIGNDGDHTYVQRQGYICDHVLGLANLSVGDYVTLDSSGIVTVSGATQTNAIGVVECIAANTLTAFIKLLL